MAIIHSASSLGLGRLPKFMHTQLLEDGTKLKTVVKAFDNDPVDVKSFLPYGEVFGSQVVRALHFKRLQPLNYELYRSDRFKELSPFLQRILSKLEKRNKNYQYTLCKSFKPDDSYSFYTATQFCPKVDFSEYTQVATPLEAEKDRLEAAIVLQIEGGGEYPDKLIQRARNTREQLEKISEAKRYEEMSYFFSALRPLSKVYGRENLEDLFLFGAVTLNHDQHFNNFGILTRKISLSETEQIEIVVGPAPLFDNEISVFSIPDWFCQSTEEYNSYICSEEIHLDRTAFQIPHRSMIALMVQPRHIGQLDDAIKTFKLQKHSHYNPSDEALNLHQEKIRSELQFARQIAEFKRTFTSLHHKDVRDFLATNDYIDEMTYSAFQESSRESRYDEESKFLAVEASSDAQQKPGESHEVQEDQSSTQKFNTILVPNRQHFDHVSTPAKKFLTEQFQSFSPELTRTILQSQISEEDLKQVLENPISLKSLYKRKASL